ncbi:MAG: endonuclease/exonuclease/phosphatase family protein [Bacteroidia bacterium]|nr:endonuclease/exonuclease/phosphatase family protein [Bacteroidia bacterium]
MQTLTLATVFCTLLLSQSFFSVQAQPDRSFRVMTFNIRLNVASDSTNAWPHRTDLVESMIRFHEADLIGVQEALENQMTDLKTILPDFGVHGVARDTSLQWGEYSAIFYRRSRFEWLDGSTFWLSESPEMASRGWDAALNRIVTWARFRDRFTDKVFFHFNTHFDHRGVEARENSARLIMDKIAELNPENLPVILTGDFNLTPTDSPYSILTQDNPDKNLKDSYFESLSLHHGPASTWSGFVFPGEGDRRIDYIFTRNRVVVLKHATLSDSWSGRYPSDHLPVLAEILIDPVMALPQAHSHNDYERSRPLWTALENGCTSVEADIWLIDDKLYVSHNRPMITPKSPTLESLYLDPLARHVTENHGWIFPGYNRPVQLLVDIKNEGEATYEKLREVLKNYDYLLKPYGNRSALLQIVISGERPMAAILADSSRRVGLDGRPEDMGESYEAAIMPLISQRYSVVTSWKGKDVIPDAEMGALKTLADQAHRQGKKIRLWATPDDENVWKVLLEAGVDYINTDDPERLKKFLSKSGK